MHAMDPPPSASVAATRHSPDLPGCWKASVARGVVIGERRLRRGEIERQSERPPTRFVAWRPRSIGRPAQLRDIDLAVGSAIRAPGMPAIEPERARVKSSWHEDRCFGGTRKEEPCAHTCAAPSPPLPVLVFTAHGVRGQCVGECSGDGVVNVNELILGVNIALGSQPLSVCRSFDCQGDGTVPINCLIQAVNNAFNSCPPTPPPTTATDTATATPTPESTATATPTTEAVPDRDADRDENAHGHGDGKLGAWFTGPGLAMTIDSATIDETTGIATVGFTLSDGEGIPLDLDGRATEGEVSVHFVAAWLDQDAAGAPLQYTAYTTRTQTSPITGDSAVQASTDSAAECSSRRRVPGRFIYTFGTRIYHR